MIGISILTLLRLREPAFVLILLFGCLLAYLLSGTNFFDLSDLQVVAVSKDNHGTLYLGTMLLTGLGLLLTLFNAASEIPKDISSRMISVLLTKPLTRMGYVWGKYCGCLFIGLFFTGFWISFMLVSKVLFSEGDHGLTTIIVLQQYVTLLILFPVTAVAISFSCVFSDMVAMIFTIIYILLAFASSFLPILGSLGQGISKFIMVIYFFFPNLLYYISPIKDIWVFLALLIHAVSVSWILLFVAKEVFDNGDVFDNIF